MVTSARLMDLIAGDRLHCLELAIGGDIERRHVVSPLGLKIGRTAPADVIIADSEVSRSHCLVALKGDELYVSDLNSTNGTFIDGVRVTGVAPLPVGSVLQVGSRTLKHEWRTRIEIDQSDDFDRDLQRAASYVKALLPPPSTEGPIRADWIYKPSTKLGGDAFGYGKLTDDLYVCYLVDVAGHGAGAAMHAVAIMNQLRQRSLPNTDMAQPELVLSTLNELFQMEDHDGLYFTIWYGVYDARTRRLNFASGGHHPAYLVPPDRPAAIPLRTRNIIIGAMPAMNFVRGSVTVPPGSSFYLFSDGVYEIIDKEGTQWTIEDFTSLILQPPVPGLSEPQRLYEAVCEQAQLTTLEDDFSLVVVTFD
ncbi:SpoIIE family protein phosphatase [Novosphingobium sp. G106]|uniref:PP2C family protein-serine/threonine phosphatase n=1 Tax=Novosphingobium sp. G106 TaxID=2849500 RepID=UPI001C2DA38D|nr:SpoIIE family protein phosphatase [Novosphingobium sp. G106]MBV1689288.1 SpoIIE family protein phosphatase [Novosphingobium sp. G106]